MFNNIVNSEVNSSALVKTKVVSNTSSIKRKSVMSLDPKFKYTESLNNFVIRDFMISEKTDPVKSSKRKLRISQNFFSDKEEKKKLEKIRELVKYEKMTGNQVFIDNVFDQNTNASIEDTENDIKKEIERSKLKSIENSKNFVEVLDSVFRTEYKKMDDSVLGKGKINVHNMHKIIRLRTVLKTKTDPDSEEINIKNLEKFREMIRLNNNKVIKALNQLGPPSFIKSKFKTTTINTFKVVNGKYFGC